jgi:hypothetical protein
VPKGLSGEFDLRLKYDAKPFDLKVSDAKLSL